MPKSKSLLLALGAAAMALSLPGCSAIEPDPVEVVNSISAVGNAKPQKRTAQRGTCKTISRYHEGFFHQAKIREWAWGELDKGIAKETAYFEKRGYTGISAHRGAMSCKATYPIGIKEWTCTATADICVRGRTKPKLKPERS